MAEKDRKPGQNGKTDAPKPFSVPMKEFRENFDRIFGKKEKK